MSVDVKLLGKVHLPDREISINDSNGVVQKSMYDLPDNWYGGSVKEFRKIRDSGFLMVMDKKDRIINIAYVEDELTNSDKESMGILVNNVVPEDNEKGDGKNAAKKGK